MRGFVFYAVVGRIVNFLLWLARGGLPRKTIIGGQKGCNITWSYVARTGKRCLKGGIEIPGNGWYA